MNHFTSKAKAYLGSRQISMVKLLGELESFNNVHKEGPYGSEVVTRRCFVEKDVLKNFANFIQKHLFIKKETLVFSSDFYKIFKNTFSTEHLQWLLLIDFFCRVLNTPLERKTEAYSETCQASVQENSLQNAPF